jgi:hypothetical protein
MYQHRDNDYSHLQDWGGHIQRRGIVAAMGLLLTGCGGGLVGPEEASPISIRFADVEESRQELVRSDDWTSRVGPLQRAFTFGDGSESISSEEFRLRLGDSARAWPDQLKKGWAEVFDRIAPKLEDLGIRVRGDIIMAATSGRESGGAPYTRGNTVFLPLDYKSDHKTDEELLAHELFHVFSRSNRGVADKVYALFGFQPAAELRWPEEWNELRIANPDAPINQHFVSLRDESGAVRSYMPVLVAEKSRLSPGETFFDALGMRLLDVEPSLGSGPTAPRRDNGRLIWRRFDSQYSEVLGSNTNNQMHPEEVAADNFAFLISGRARPNQALLDRLRQLLRSRGGSLLGLPIRN